MARRRDGKLTKAPENHDPYRDAARREQLDADLMGVSLRDWQMYIAEHATIFGHVPRPDPIQRIYCNHPLHGLIQRDIQADGVNIALRHEQVAPHTTHSLDDAEIDPTYGSKEYIEDAGRPWDGPREFIDDRDH